LPLVGWVASSLSRQMERTEENLGYLRERLGAPLLGVLPFCTRLDPVALGRRIDVAPLLG
jgi:dethiobiotin synthetase